MTATIGSIYQRADGSAGACLYIKESGLSTRLGGGVTIIFAAAFVIILDLYIDRRNEGCLNCPHL